MDRTYIIPSNSKKQGLIFGFLKFPDLILFGISTLVTFLLFSIFSISDLGSAILCMLPMLIAGFLVFPIPNYHNSRFLIGTIIRFYFKDIRKYYWRGWCYNYEQPNEQSDEQQSRFTIKF